MEFGSHGEYKAKRKKRAADYIILDIGDTEENIRKLGKVRE